jgi:hypothetical protein
VISPFGFDFAIALLYAPNLGEICKGGTA